MQHDLSGQLITLFGGGGFIGRYAAQQLLAKGARLRVVQRRPEAAAFLKPLGNLGQTQFAAVDIRNAASVARAIAGSDAVVNLVGAFADMDAVQHQGAAHIAQAAQSAGVTRLVHVSAIGADVDSPATYGRSKGLGEQAVRAAVPNATILRPSTVFGREDQFINRFAAMIRLAPVVPLVAPAAKFQPVYVGDFASAIAAALGSSNAAGQTYELGGPQTLSMEDLFRWIARTIGRNPLFLPLPDAAASAMARATGWLPGAPLTWDQWLMLQKDTVVAPGAATLADLDIIATALDTVAPEWLVTFRRHGRFAMRNDH
ncbi:MAG: complex I NDUFA9 subunit family protein [Sphingopyxis sp.]|nr:complex I NDUFA9 subunit family protein [Sphingopyxis sp.]